ncbi:MAG: tetraacyldisaccharide 4'-kinase, partial [Alphaproteobacteria bacterium]|nr:tetraacyldisaccharide 4'-kinase [Alphaproteobacteria bacterium]
MIAPSFWKHKGVISTILLPFSWLYGAIVQFRLKKIGYKSKAKVICVGNVTAGGVGKTPVCMALAEKYIKEGKKVCFLTRGYKGKLKNIVVDLEKHSAIDTGDEARLLASVTTTIISPDRANGAKIAEELGMDVIIMDDGFQNPSLLKDE